MLRRSCTTSRWKKLVHAGEFTNLLYRLNPIAAQKAKEGFAEVDALLAASAPTEDVQESPVAAPQGLTVGNMVGMAQSQ